MKRKFKIIFAIVAVMAMLFAFAISSSAWTNSSPGQSGSVDEDYWYIYDIDKVAFYGYAFTSSDLSGIEISLDYFGILDDGVIERMNEAIASGSSIPVNLYHSSGWLNPEEKDSIFSRYTREEVKLAFEQEYAKFSALLEKEFTQSDLDNAVEEYKNSTEYKLEVLEEVKKITGGESDGVKVFGNSDFSTMPVKNIYQVVLPFGENGEKLLYIGANLIESNPALLISPSNLREFMSFKNLTSLDEFFTFVSEEYYNDLYLSSLNPNIDKEWFGNIHYMFNYFILSDGESEGNYYISAFEDLFLEALNYSEFTSDSLDAKYNEGVEAGKAEGKTEGYTEGFAEGMESFKESEAYANALQVQYATGKTDGVTEFKKSVAFKNTLKGEYDNGYDAGVADTEGQVVKNEFTKVLSIFIGVMGFGIILMSVLGIASKFKKKAKRR